MASTTTGKEVDSQPIDDQAGGMAKVKAKAKAKAKVKAKAKDRSRARANDHPKEEIQRAGLLFRQISDSTRLWIVLLLSHGERNVGELCQEMGGFPQPSCSHHLALLRFGGLVESKKEGRNNFYSLTCAGRRLVEVARHIVEDEC